MKILITFIFLSITLSVNNFKAINSDSVFPLKGNYSESIINIFDDCISELKRREGYSEVPYIDTDGKTRIGYGTLSVKRTSISKPEAEQLLIQEYLKHVNQIKIKMNSFCFSERQYMALGMLSYNVGFHGFKYYNGQLSGLYKQLIKGENPVNWLKYIKVKGEPSSNLINSRIIEYKIFNNEF